MTALLAWIQDGEEATGWANHQQVHPTTLVMIVLLSFAMLVVRRRWAIGPFFLVVGFITAAQRFVVAGLDFPMLRILILVGWVRIILRGEIAGFRFRGLDVLILAWGLSQVLTQAALTASEYPGALGDVLIFRCGWVVDNLGAYFLFRILVRGWDDLQAILKLMAVLAIPTALLFILEKATGRNLFSVFGGVSEFTEIREGKLRCQGSFEHPILAGCLWVGMVPLFAALCWSRHPWKGRAIVAIVCSLIIVICCASSTPLVGFVVAVFGVLMFPFRAYLWLLQIGIPLVLMGLHLCMKKPVWHLLARIDMVGGSTGYHRYRLIDNTISHFNEWWLLGTRSTAHWGYLQSDITNYYVLQAVAGGLLTLVLFLAAVVVAFRGVGRILRLNRHDHGHYMMTWLLGVSLLVHCAMFMAISYFQKPLLLWTLTLAAIPSLELASIASARRRAVLAACNEDELMVSLEPQAN